MIGRGRGWSLGLIGGSAGGSKYPNRYLPQAIMAIPQIEARDALHYPCLGSLGILGISLHDFCLATKRDSKRQGSFMQVRWSWLTQGSNGTQLFGIQFRDPILGILKSGFG